MPKLSPKAPPSPVTPVAFLRGWKLQIRCGTCRHAAELPLAALPRQLDRVAIHTVIDRLRCREPGCGGRPARVVLAEIHGGRQILALDAMPPTKLIPMSAVVARLTMIDVACDRCKRHGRYRTAGIALRFHTLTDFQASLQADCTVQHGGGWGAGCAVMFPSLPKVF